MLSIRSAGGVADTQMPVGEYAAQLTSPATSAKSAEPEPEVEGHEETRNAKMSPTKCDWPLNVTWIFQHYNNVSDFSRL